MGRYRGRLGRVWLAWLGACLLLTTAQAEEGITGDRILLGQSAAMSGPSGELGQLFLYGARAYFDKVNARGGVHGRKIRILSLDDAYQPDKAIANTAQLIHVDKVFALFGYVGTATVAAAMPLVNQAGIPLFAPMSGAHFLREPFNPLVFNIRAGHVRETEYLLRQLQGNGQRNIAVLYQNDDFGKATLKLLRVRAEFYGLQLAAALAVDRSSEEVGRSVAAALAAAPDMVVLVAPYPTAAAFITRMRRAGYRGGFSNYSFVGSKSLADRLHGAGAGTMITQVVPFPWRPQVPVVYEYQKLCKMAEGVEYSFVSLEGFIAARAMVEGLRRAGRNLTREGLIRALESINPSNYDGGGFELSFSAASHNGSDFVDLTAIGSRSRFIN